MSGFNQTGPMGQGPMTGRQMGRCTNFGASLKVKETKNEENSDEKTIEFRVGRGFGPGPRNGGRGQGMGRRNRFKSCN